MAVGSSNVFGSMHLSTIGSSIGLPSRVSEYCGPPGGYRASLELVRLSSMHAASPHSVSLKRRETSDRVGASSLHSIHFVHWCAIPVSCSGKISQCGGDEVIHRFTAT